jgi:hypothetical protein
MNSCHCLLLFMSSTPTVVSIYISTKTILKTKNITMQDRTVIPFAIYYVLA